MLEKHIAGQLIAGNATRSPKENGPTTTIAVKGVREDAWRGE